jgi:hypothetical protein
MIDRVYSVIQKSAVVGNNQEGFAQLAEVSFQQEIMATSR